VVNHLDDYCFAVFDDEILSKSPIFMDKPITSYIQVLNIIVYFAVSEFSSLLLGRVRFTFWEQGAMTAILLISRIPF
jgi:miniconductance mechanosensitive channel